VRNCKRYPYLTDPCRKEGSSWYNLFVFPKDFPKSPPSEAFKKVKQLWEKWDISDLDKKLARTQELKWGGLGEVKLIWKNLVQTYKTSDGW